MVLIMMITGAKCLIVMCNYSTHQPWLIVVVLNDEDDDGDSNKIQVNMRKSQSLSVMLILLINAATLMNGLIWETKHRKPCFFHVFFMFCFLKVGTRFNHKFLGFDMPVNQTQGHPLVHTCWSLICLFQLDKPVGPQKTRLCEADLIGFGGSVVSNTTRRMEKKNTAGVLFLLSWCWGSCWNLLIIAWGLSQIKGTASYRFPKCPASSACGSSSITEIKPRHEVPTNNDIICITTYTYILYIYYIYILYFIYSPKKYPDTNQIWLQPSHSSVGQGTLSSPAALRVNWSSVPWRDSETCHLLRAVHQHPRGLENNLNPKKGTPISYRYMNIIYI